MGVKGRRWALPSAPDEITARQQLLAALGLPESAIDDNPESPDRAAVQTQMFPEEREWLNALSRRAGLTKHLSPARIVRLLIRAAIVHRDLLPDAPELVSDAVWVAETTPPSLSRLLPLLTTAQLCALQNDITNILGERSGDTK